MTPKAWLKKEAKAGRLNKDENASDGWITYTPTEEYALVYRGKEQALVSISPTGEIVLDNGSVSRAKKNGFQLI